MNNVGSSTKVERPMHEANLFISSISKDKNACSFTSAPIDVFMASCVIKHRKVLSHFYKHAYNNNNNNNNNNKVKVKVTL